MKIELNKHDGVIICGDNLEWLNEIQDESVDLCYLDPPFFSNRQYEVIWGNGYELRAFGDRFAGGISHYIEWMRPRIELIHKKLKKTGSMFIHCDWHASHRLRCLMDDVFTERFFRSEIIWRRANAKGLASNNFPNNHDTIFYYTKSEKYTFHRQFGEHDPEYVEKFYKYKDKDGRRYTLGDLTNPNPDRPNLTYTWKGHHRVWRWTKERMKEADKKGLIHYTSTGLARQKRFLDEVGGQPIDTLWDDILPIQAQSNERLGYPTQKPEALIKRIIECASNPGDIVLDCFAGGGTSAKVAADLGRKFIVGDVSPVACKLMIERISRECKNAKFQRKNLPQSEKELRAMNGHEFAETVCDLMGWQSNERKSNDGGIDGWDAHSFPVQVKNQKTSAGRPEMQKFYGALAKEKKKRGLFVAWEFSPGAFEFIADMKREHGVEIVPLKCAEVFGALLLDQSKSREVQVLFEERFPEAWLDEHSVEADRIKLMRKTRSKHGQNVRRSKEKNAG